MRALCGALAILVVFASPVWAAVAFDAKMTTGNSSDGFNQEASSTTTISSTGITVGGSATCLVATLVVQTTTTFEPSVTAFTWDGGAMTAGPSVGIQKAGGEWDKVWIYYKTNPASGAKTLSATTDQSGSDLYLSAVSFTSTDTSACVNAANNVTTSNVTSITVTGSTGGATVAVFGVDGSAPSIGGSGTGCGTFTKIWSEAPLNPGGGASYQTSDGASCTHSFTGAGGSVQALAGVNVVAGAGGGAAPRTRLNLMGVGN